MGIIFYLVAELYHTFSNTTDLYTLSIPTQWSYGITCWEVYSLGRTPYPNISNHEILKFIDEGNRPPKPNLCTDLMYVR